VAAVAPAAPPYPLIASQRGSRQWPSLITEEARGDGR
jgi:hypothetical protein